MAVVFFVFLTGYNLAMRLLGVGAKVQNKKYPAAAIKLKVVTVDFWPQKT